MCGSPRNFCLQPVTKEPGQQIFVTFFSGGNLQNDVGELLLCIRKLHAVDRQKNQHGVGADSLVAVYERIIFYQTVTEPGGLLLERGIGAGIAKGLKRRVESGIQKPLVPQARTAAGLSHPTSHMQKTC